MTRRGVLGMLRDIRRVQRLIATDLQTTIRGRFPLAAAPAALRAYRENMTAGKALLVADPTQVPVTENFSHTNEPLTTLGSVAPS